MSKTDRFQDAIDLLPQVRTNRKDKNRRFRGVFGKSSQLTGIGGLRKKRRWFSATTPWTVFSAEPCRRTSDRLFGISPS
jgi:hypothetical protein